MLEGKWIDRLAPGTPLVDAARHVLSVRFAVVCRYLPCVDGDGIRDSENVHQLRVATRRAGAGLEIFRDCLSRKGYDSARKALRKYRRAAGAGRDWDVFLMAASEASKSADAQQRPGYDFLIGHGFAQRLHAQQSIEERCANEAARLERLIAEILDNLHRPSRPRLKEFGALAMHPLPPLLEEFDLNTQDHLEDFDRLHSVRILGKQLRYALEVFVNCFSPALREQLYPQVEDVQSILGDINDARTTVERLTTHRNAFQLAHPFTAGSYRPGIDRWLRQLETKLRVDMDRFSTWLASWKQSQPLRDLGRLKV